ncbi:MULTISPECIES: TMEM175 family protein [unclassified Enterococcus]|uniref:TMEM175 family protein n=1 Tax=unclassified Enterococcus TaxID=2608891 RepID=UPI001555DD28|nr:MULTISPECIES: TMEM175 family protein [unclassified Enterococcus]MBS7576374.1 DUF1211 domain-containing protein [Enterococcus sp. MMGLQ5-2]MBS7583606.1 DUF1211 domain-containing protein [Enterococcus sp. MMGLQ5-1]NPD11467.1 DUF1211 domain-containing protein [Enterococcus sp. MMGLQ5-1]NPD36211.1 DUF1211 domain-containing protein [Enterococcus sp. MMGLQ5-2]
MSKERLTTFIDAVIAIIMTILVLDLPHPELMTWDGLLALRANFFSYALSFFWLGTMWVNRHNEWQNIKVIGKDTVWYALLMLFFASLFPYTTSLVAENFSNAVAQSLYGIIVLMVTLFNSLSYRSLVVANKEKKVFYLQQLSRKHFMRWDIAIKMIGLIITIFIWPPAMTLSILIAAVIILAYPEERSKV